MSRMNDAQREQHRLHAREYRARPGYVRPNRHDLCGCGKRKLLTSRTCPACLNRSPRPIAERFWEKVDKSGDCWVWTGHIGDCGYGRFSVNGTVTYAHRVAWELTNGSLPTGTEACHHCDNPPCVRPDHLFAGTHTDNMRDASRKGRLQRASA